MTTNKAYGHTELAQFYFPNSTPKSAGQQLMRWMLRDDDLLADLRLAGYRKGLRVYTPRQVSILVDHLGDPETWNIR